MRIENPPNWFEEPAFSDAVKLRKTIPGIDSVIRHINGDYPYWDKVKYIKTEYDLPPQTLWTLIKLTRLYNRKELKFGTHTFQYNIIDKIQKGLHEFDMNLGGSLGSTDKIPDGEKHRYLMGSIMEEAIASSQIEGAVTTRKKAKEMLRKNAKPTNTSERMIANNFKTIKHIVEKKNEALTLEKLFEIHKLITFQTLDDNEDSGRFRDNNDINVVDAHDGEIAWIPPSFDQVPALINELLLFFNNNDEENFVHPIIKGCIIHFMIGYIHPFVDGNGRVARALFYWYLLRNGYWLTEYLSISRLIVKSKVQYAQAYLYSEIDDNDLTYFIKYKIKTMELAFDELKKYIERKINEKKQVTAFTRIKGVNERQAFLINWAYEEPDIIFSVKEIQDRFNISNQTARTDLKGLEDLKFFEEFDLNNKTKAFGRTPDFDERIKKLVQKENPE
jgi:Fic family protein